MPTPYSAIHQVAIQKISAYGLLDFQPSDREAILNGFLKSAVVDFSRICKVDLSDRDDLLAQFNNDLDEEIIEILATGEAYYWAKPKVANEDNFYNLMNSGDYSFFSPANLLDKMMTMQELMAKDFRKKMMLYSYKRSNIAKLSANNA